MKSDKFAEGVQELEQICEHTARQLVVREWTFINFMPYEPNGWNPPNRLLTLEAIEKRCEVIPFAFVRDSIDVWISNGSPAADVFLNSIFAMLKRYWRIGYRFSSMRIFEEDQTLYYVIFVSTVA